MKVPELSKQDITQTSSIKICQNLSVAIESAIYIQNSESLVNNHLINYRIIITKKNLKHFI